MQTFCRIMFHYFKFLSSCKYFLPPFSSSPPPHPQLRSPPLYIILLTQHCVSENEPVKMTLRHLYGQDDKKLAFFSAYFLVSCVFWGGKSVYFFSLFLSQLRILWEKLAYFLASCVFFGEKSAYFLASYVF